MSNSNNVAKYDEALSSILVNENSILGFLSTIFDFLARRTDFYYVPEGPYENMGFPPGVAEELVVKVLRMYNPNNWKPPNGTRKPLDVNNEIMCSMVAQEVEIEAEDGDDSIETPGPEDDGDTIEARTETVNSSSKPADKSIHMPCNNLTNTEEPSAAANEPPVIPTQKNSETYNGAQRENYSWSQTIMELDVTVKLPPDIKSAKDLKVTINPGDICVACRTGITLIKDTLLFKVKTIESFWSISEGKLLIHLEKVQERWWNKFLENEEPIDLSKIDCSRPLYELPDDHIEKVREIQWNQEQKLRGLPTSDQLRNIEILKKAWDADGSPFRGQKFDPNMVHIQ